MQVHNDWFHPEDPFYQDRVRLRGQRLVSVFCYLCDVPEGGGGGTFFPALNLRFLPRTGCAALWWNQTHDTKIMDERVGHCGEKPTKGKQKWGLNVWLRERASKEGAVYRRDPIGRVVTEDGLVRFFPPPKIPA
jgi:prolyl 4-hydroxylase